MTPETQAALRIERLGKRFPSPSGPLDALSGIDLDVKANEFVALVGASGCGKSTLLRIVAGLDAPSSGAIRLNGRPVTGPAKDRAMVFQEYSLFPWLTVEKNIRFSRGLKVHDDRYAIHDDVFATVDRMHALIEVMGLRGLENVYPNQLSGGMRQRVAIARALLSRPGMLLMDEPFGALDCQTREVMHDLLLHLFHLERPTILFVTHDVEEAIYLAQRVVVLAPRPGRIDSIFDVNLPGERYADLRLEPDFIELKRQITHRIRETSGMATDPVALQRIAMRSAG
jgi:NitT/TauT family transport system ATP-binding protein